MNRTDLITYLDTYLGINEIKDYGPQGLQIEGRTEVQRIVGLVDAHQPCVEAAIAAQADLMLVHHGIFGEAQNRCLAAMVCWYGHLWRPISTSTLHI